jgi:hypothetical protein
MRSILPLLALLALAVARAAIVDCACDPAHPESLEARQCGLCREAEKQPPDVGIFFIKDASPRKPNRWLALPRAHYTGYHAMHEMPAKDRAELWAGAIAKAQELWGDEWGLAYNGEEVRSQCHTHIHIGKLLEGVERDNFIVVSKPSEIPVAPGEGLWVHPVGKKLHVHTGEQICETVLLR